MCQGHWAGAVTGRDRCGKPGEEAEGGAAGLPCSIPSQRSAAPCPAVRVAQASLPAKPQLGLPSAGAGAAWPLPRSEERPFLTGSSQSVELSWGPEEAWRLGGLAACYPHSMLVDLPGRPRATLRDPQCRPPPQQSHIECGGHGGGWGGGRASLRSQKCRDCTRNVDPTRCCRD